VGAVPMFVAERNFTLSWSTPPDFPGGGSSGVNHYRVRVIAGAGHLPVENVTTNEFALRLVDGRAYRILVAAVDRAGNVGPEVLAEFTADLEGPPAPTGLRVAFVGTNSPIFTAEWNPATDTGAGVRDYRIRIGTSPGAEDVVAGETVSGTKYEWHGSFGRPYYVTVWSVDQVDNEGSGATLAQPFVANAPSQGFDLLGLILTLLLAAGAGVIALVALRRRSG